MTRTGRVLPLMIVLALLGCGDSDADNPEGSAEVTAGADYTTQGEFGEGFLYEQLIPGAVDQQKFTKDFEKSPVLLKGYLPYPNPYSHQAAFVAVGRQADFRLEARSASGERIDSFTFSRVEPGFYGFTCSGVEGSKGLVKVILWHEEKEVGEISILKKVLHNGY